MSWKLLIVPALLVAALVLYLGLKDRAPTTTVAARADAGTDDVVDEAERKDYLAKYVELSELKVEPDQKPDDAGPVQGLLAAQGVVSNKGPRGLRSLKVVILPEDASKNVLGAYTEDVLSGQRLAPGDSKAFKFTVPAKPGFAGTFQQHLK